MVSVPHREVCEAELLFELCIVLRGDPLELVVESYDGHGPLATSTEVRAILPRATNCLGF